MIGRKGAANVRRQGRLATRPSDGVIEARSAEGRLLAHFNPTTNETRDTQGTLIGKGNRLAAVLREKDAASAQNGDGSK